MEGYLVFLPRERKWENTLSNLPSLVLVQNLNLQYMYSHAPRITLSYAELVPVLQIWSPLCERMAVYEHTADSSCKRTHCHILIEECKVKDDALRRGLYKALPAEKRKGNDLWSWEHKKWKESHPNQQYNDQMLNYMSKGSIAPSFVKNYSPALIEERKKQWKITTPNPVKSSDEDAYDEYKEICKSFDDYSIHNDIYTLMAIRKWLFTWYYRKTGKAPHATNYKRYACSLYMRLSDRKGNIEGALDEIINLWY